MPVIETLTVERRRGRGFFGWIFLLVFLAWQALFVMWFGSYVLAIGQKLAADHNQYGQAGTVIGGTIGMTFIVLIWGFGSCIFGLLAYVSRGRREMVTTHLVDETPAIRPAIAEAGAPLSISADNRWSSRRPG